MAAKTNWKDYVPDSKGVRYQLVSNGDGTYNIVDATNYEVVGDKVTAEALNLIGTIINNLISGTQPAGKLANGLTFKNSGGTDLYTFDGSQARTLQLTPSITGAEPAFTKNSAFNRNFGESADTVCRGNDGRLSNARRASNITMSSPDANLWILYS